MRNRFRLQGLGRRLAGPAIPLGQVVLTVTDDGANSLRVTTAGAHGLATGAAVILADTLPDAAGYNIFEATEVVVEDATRFLIDQAVIPYDGDAAGGTWRLA